VKIFTVLLEMVLCCILEQTCVEGQCGIKTVQTAEVVVNVVLPTGLIMETSFRFT